MTFWTRYLFAISSCLVHCRIFSSSLDLYLLNDSNAVPLVVTTKTVSRHCQMTLWVHICPYLRTTDLERKKKKTTVLEFQAFRVEIISDFKKKVAKIVPLCPLPRFSQMFPFCTSIVQLLKAINQHQYNTIK